MPQIRSTSSRAPAAPLGTRTRPGSGLGASVELPSSAEQAPPQLAPATTNAERLQRLFMLNDAVLYEDEVLQIGIKAEYSGCNGQVGVYFGNKTMSPLQNFTVQYLVPDEKALRLVAPPLNQQIGAEKQVLQRIRVSLLAPFMEMPLLRASFLLPDSSTRRVQTRLPVALTKFMVGRELSAQELFGLWRRQAFSLAEAANTVQLGAHLQGAHLAHVAKCASLGGTLRLHHDIDANPCNLVFVAQIVADRVSRSSVEDAEDLCIIRVEVGSGRSAGRARVAVRSSDRAAARAVCEVVVGQLAEAGVPSSGGSEGR